MGTKFILGQEDGTIAGGDARGANAVDLQTARTASYQVAIRDYTVVLGGQSNTSDGDDGRWGVVVGGLNNRQRTAYGVVVGGQSNQTGDGNAANSHIFIGGGSSNYSNGSYSVITGGRSNTTGNSYCTVSGGQSNTASSNAHATVVGGLQNTSSGQYSISGGYVNVASGMGAVALGGGANATGYYSLATGINTFATGSHSCSFGLWSQAYLYGQTATQAGRFNGQSDAQISSLIARIEAALTTGGTTVLSLDGTGTTNLIIPNGTNRMWKVKVEYVGTITTITGTATGLTVGDSVYGEENFGFKKLAGTSTMGPIMNETQSSDNAIMDTCSLAVTAGAQAMALTFTGPTFAGGGSVTMRIVAKVALVEVAF